MNKIDILNTSWKTEVTPEQSAEIQRLLFKFGKSWAGKKCAYYIHEPHLYYRGVLTNGDNIEFFATHPFEKINAEDIIAALRKLDKEKVSYIIKCPTCNKILSSEFETKRRPSRETIDTIISECECKQEKPMTDETSEDGWIRVFDSMPPLNREVEVKLQDKTIKRITMRNHAFMDYFISVPDPHVNSTILWWRHIKEKRKPDFGKLREGDLIIVEWKNEKNEKGKFVGFFDSLGDDSIYINPDIGEDFRSIDCAIDYIKKITRIDPVKQTFEEI
jgi:hypothetical protein